MIANDNLGIKDIAGPLAVSVNHDRAFRNGWYSDNRSDTAQTPPGFAEEG